MHLGFPGAAVLGLFDSAAIPVPIDAVIALYVWNDKRHFWVYPLLAAAGSAVGGLLPYWLGRAGGELFLLKRINRARFDQLRHRFENQEFVAVLVPSMMPPPTPWKVFIFSAGVFEMRVPWFLLAVFSGRTIRWMALALLVLKLGPGAVTMVAHHALPAVIVVGCLAAVAVAWWWIRIKRAARRNRTKPRREL